MKQLLPLLMILLGLMPGVMATPAIDENPNAVFGDPNQVFEVDGLPFLEFQLAPVVTYASGDIDSIGYGLQTAVFPGDEFGLQFDYIHFAAGIEAISCSVVKRHLGTIIEPYVIMGGGVLTSSDSRATWHAGAGLNHWLKPTVSLFTEARFTWVDASNEGTRSGDYPSIAAGVRVSF